jgi:hypothetical protein
MLPGMVVTFTVNRNGSVRDVVVEGLASPMMSDQIVRQVSQWLVAPAHDARGTVKSRREMRTNLMCFPAFPGHPEAAACQLSADKPSEDRGPGAQ